jgi:hypothetical protein
MAHHQNAPAIGSQLDQFLRMPHLKSQGLLYIDILVCKQSVTSDRVVGSCPCTDGDSIDIRAIQNLLIVSQAGDIRVGCSSSLEITFLQVRDRNETSSPNAVKVSDDVLPPVARSNNRQT